MIIIRTPFRISFFGGGTDYPAWFEEHPGQVISTTINQYCYITCRYLPPFFDYKYQLRYRKHEFVNQIDEIQHPSIQACLKTTELKEGIELVHASDIPARSGIGSSSAFTVGCLHALQALKGKMVNKRELAQQALYVEQDVLKEYVGSQDQIAAAFGGLNLISFKTDKSFYVEPIPISEEMNQALQSHVMFFFTGFARNANDIAKVQVEHTPQNQQQLHQMYGLVQEALQILQGDIRKIEEFGELLDASWKLKRTLTDKITNPQIDTYYDAARRAGAIGGKLCGAGGGGFMVLFVPPEKQGKVRKALHHLLEVPIRFDKIGSHILFYGDKK